jgi:BirA family biotin operon repressor/biotin-[acetyl-CoA-carboxylase] ligase
MAEPVVEKQLHAVQLKAAAAEAGVCNMDVVVHEKIDSTNSWSMQHCRAGKALPFACFADEQTSGRGRRGKQWVMSPGCNIAMSLTWPFASSCRQLYLLPLSISIAIVETLESLNLKQVEIKWPNDVYVQGKKIAGILIETQANTEKRVDAGVAEMPQVAVTIGVGLNYDMSALKFDGAQLMTVFTDVCDQLTLQSANFKPDRAFVASTLLRRVIHVCQSFQQNSAQYLEKFRRQYDFCKDKAIEITLDDGRVLSGVAQGVSDNAELLVLIEGRQHVFNSAMVSVKAGPAS